MHVIPYAASCELLGFRTTPDHKPLNQLALIFFISTSIFESNEARADTNFHYFSIPFSKLGDSSGHEDFFK